jgi:hypothetical protein
MENRMFVKSGSALSAMGGLLTGSYPVEIRAKLLFQPTRILDAFP